MVQVCLSLLGTWSGRAGENWCRLPLCTSPFGAAAPNEGRQQPPPRSCSTSRAHHLAVSKCETIRSVRAGIRRTRPSCRCCPPPRVAPLRLTSIHCSNGRDSPPTHWPWACHLAHHSKASGPCLVLQVLLSLQALVLVEQPYFNEPGCEGDAHTPAGPNPKPKLFKGAVCCTVLRALCAAQCCVRCVRYAACGERPPPASRCLLWFGFSPCYGVCEQSERTDTAAQLQAMLRQHDITKGPRC